MPEQFLHKGILADFGKNFDLMQSKSVCPRGVLVFFASGATARTELRQWIAEELGAFRNLVDVFMKGCRGEVEDAVGSSLAPFDIDNWPRTGSPETLPCPQHLRPACGPILVTVPFSVIEQELKYSVAKEIESKNKKCSMFYLLHDGKFCFCR